MAKTHLDLEIASGNIPDMIFTGPQNSNFLLFKHYIDSGVFADLNPLLDSVNGFDRNDLLGYLTKPYTDKNGCQYIIPIYSINGTYFSNGSIHGPMTAEELIEIYDTMPEYTNLVSDFLTFYFLYGCVDDFIDYEKATCCFDDGKFEKILRFCREAESKGTNRSYNNLKRAELYELVKEGKLLLIDIPQIRSPISWALLKNDFGGALVPVGYPNEKKEIIASLSAGINTFIGITEASRHKDIAADFISTFYSIPDIDINEYGVNHAIGQEDFSIRRSRIYALVKMLEDYTIIDEYTVVPDSEADNYTGAKIKLTKEIADEFIAYLDSISKNVGSSGPVWEIILEEILSNLDRDPADIAKYIQDRVSIYLSEQN